jgi:excisionase family DNA binding protein
LKKIALTVKEAAQLLGLHTNTVRREIWRGNLKAVRLGHRVLVPVAELERLFGPMKPPAGTGGER